MQGNILKFEEVWLAKPERAMSINKTIVFDDKYGDLIFNKENEIFSYRGQSTELKDCRIVGLILRRQKLSIMGYLK